jgi:hypothetical protein
MSTPTWTLTAGQHVLIGCSWTLGSGTPSVVSQLGNTCTQIVNDTVGNSSGQSIGIWLINNAANGGTEKITATGPTGTGGTGNISYISFSCSIAGSLVVRSGTAASGAIGTSTTPTSNAVTATAGDLQYALLTTFGGSAGIGSGYTVGTNDTYWCDEYRLSSAGGSVTGAFTSAGGNWLAALAVLGPPASAVGLEEDPGKPTAISPEMWIAMAVQQDEIHSSVAFGVDDVSGPSAMVSEQWATYALGAEEASAFGALEESGPTWSGIADAWAQYGLPVEDAPGHLALEDIGAPWAGAGDTWIAFAQPDGDTWQAPIHVEDIGGTYATIPEQWAPAPPTQTDDIGHATAFIDDLGLAPTWNGPEAWNWQAPPPDDTIQRGTLDEPGGYVPWVPEPWTTSPSPAEDSAAYGALDDVGGSATWIGETWLGVGVAGEDIPGTHGLDDVGASWAVLGEAWASFMPATSEERAIPLYLEDHPELVVYVVETLVRSLPWQGDAIVPFIPALDDPGVLAALIGEVWVQTLMYGAEDAFARALKAILNPQSVTTALAGPVSTTSKVPAPVSETTALPSVESTTWRL